MTTPQDLAARKEHLIAQSDIDRVRLAHAVLGVRSAVSPLRMLGFAGGAPLRSIAGTLIGFAIPALGATRARGLLRVAAFAVAIVRMMRRFVRR
jgi:Na+-transporting NADH:ubiquinone oxidoreductase subunit NqrB